MLNIDQFKQTNAITGARYDYTVTEKRLIYNALIEVEQIVSKGLPDNFFLRELDLFISEAQLKKHDASDNHYRDYRKAVVNLRKKDFSIDMPDGSWIETGFVARGKYIKGKGLEVSISRDVLPYLYELTKRFTILDATVVMTLTSKFSQRFYEYCCQWRKVGHFELTPDELKTVFCLKMTTGNIKQFVIEIAQSELIKLYQEGISDLYFTYSEVRGGRGRGGAVHRWLFVIHTKKKAKEAQRANNAEMTAVVRFLSEIFGEKSSLIDKALDALQTHENVKKFADRIDNLQVSGKIDHTKNKAGYIRSILQKEFGMDKND